MKLNNIAEAKVSASVAPPAGAWIETVWVWDTIDNAWVAPPAGAWIETLWELGQREVPEVAPPAGAWIETKPAGCTPAVRWSRSPRGSVD